MNILIVPVPIFDTAMAVSSYAIRYQRGNDLLPLNQTANLLDGAMTSPLLETINVTGIDALSMGKPVFIPISPYHLLGNLETNFEVYKDTVIFLLEDTAKLEGQYVDRMKALRERGFRFALQKGANCSEPLDALDFCDYVFIDNRLCNNNQVLNFKSKYPKLSFVIAEIETMELYEQLIKFGFTLFEGEFYRMPVTKGATSVSPLKANLIRLLNVVRDEDFEFSEITKIVQRDTALTLSLLQIVNSPSLGLPHKVSNISNAVAILGEAGLRKWTATAVSRLLGADKPSEITKLSLIRAKFAENLSPLFDLAIHSQALFLVGLFSVLDAVLELPMSKVLNMVLVSDPIRQALETKTGEFSPVYNFILSYEHADWGEVSRQLIMHDISVESIYDAYISATIWFKELLFDTVIEAEDE